VDAYKLKNGTVYTVLAIGEEAVDESRLPVLEARVAGILRLGKRDEPFPYMNERIMAAALRTSRPLGHTERERVRPNGEGLKDLLRPH